MRSHNRMCMDTFVCCSVHMKTPETLAKRRRKEFFSVWPPPSRVYTFLFYLHITMDAWMWYPHLTAFSLYSRSRLITHELFRRNSIARSVLFFLFRFFLCAFRYFFVSLLPLFLARTLFLLYPRFGCFSCGVSTHFSSICSRNCSTYGFVKII